MYEYNHSISSCKNDIEACAFSFGRTLQALIESAGLEFNDDTESAFLNSLAQTFLRPDSGDVEVRDGHFVDKNPDSGLIMPVEKIFDALEIDHFKEDGEFLFEPIAIFNRIDKAPNDFLHCGEHRVVYRAEIKEKPFYLIFEGAMMPNPLAIDRKQGCRHIAEFWANLSAQGTIEDTMERLERFFYEGIATVNRNGGDRLEINLGSGLIDYRNYGSGPTGQVRGNIRISDERWLLREWRVMPKDGNLEFRIETLKDNPYAELYRDNYDAENSGWANGAIWAKKNQITFDTEKTLFKLNFANQLNKLKIIKNYRYKYYVDEIVSFISKNPSLCLPKKFEIPRGPEYSIPDGIELNLISNSTNNRFNEFQGNAQLKYEDNYDYNDIFPEYLGRNFENYIGSTLDFLKLSKLADDKFEKWHVFNRAFFTSCGGCHKHVSKYENLSNDLILPSKPSFVHVGETGINSEILEYVFLPWRQINLAYFIYSEKAGFFSVPPPSAQATGSDLVLLRALTELQSEVKESWFFPGSGTRRQLAEIESLVNLLRESDARKGGAFVPHRRPH